MAGTTLSLAEWTVLTVLDEAPAHGFAVATLTAPEGDLGRVWHVPRPVVYRSIARLEAAGLLEPVREEHGRGPRRQVHRVTPLGHVQVREWLGQPVGHVREVRSALLMKLALLDRRGADPTPLLSAQAAALEPIVAGLRARPPELGFDAALAAWRRTNAEAVLTFVIELLAGHESPPGPDPLA